MKINIFIILLFASVLLEGCIKESLPLCPDSATAVFKIYAEKFQTDHPNIPEDIESSFADRIFQLHCYLYRNDTLICDSLIPAITSKGNHYEIYWPGLSLGSYRLIVFGNSENIIEGNMKEWKDLTIHYPGNENLDYFDATYTFEVDCFCMTLHEIVLLRTSGIVSYVLKNIPSHLYQIDFELQSLYNKKSSSEYMGDTIVTYPYDVRLGNNNILCGTFPTNQKYSSLNIRLYGQGNLLYYEEEISNQLKIRRNQKTEILLDFQHQGIPVEVHIKDWEGSNEINGGEVR